MDVGIGLPATIPGVEGKQLTEWASKADDAGFSTLATIDRIVYDNYEPITALAAAAAVTDRIRLTTAIVLAPTRPTALLAKQAATLHHLSGGRLVLGVAVGLREDDFEAVNEEFGDRGKRFEEQLVEMERIWSGENGAIGPKVETPPALLIGGTVDAAYKRVARYGAGWIMGGGTPEMLADGKQKAEAAWKDEGRDGEPRIAALAYYALGDDAEKHADSYLRHYYGWLGEMADQIAGSAATDEDTVKQYLEGFEQAGCDELILFPASPDPEQVDLLAEVALGREDG